MYNPLTKHLNQTAVIARCTGGSLNGSGYSSNFHSSAAGWTEDQRVSFNGSNMLGRFDYDQSTTIGFDYDGSPHGVFIAFDFWEIDSWDNEHFYAYINGKQVDLGTFRHQDRVEDKINRYGESDGIQWQKVNSSDAYNRGFAGWEDQKHHIQIYIPADELRGQNFVLLSLQGGLNSGPNDESWAIDNFLARDASLNDTHKFDFASRNGSWNHKEFTNIEGHEVLGTYAVGNWTEQTFKHTQGADGMVLEFTFYELDSWDNENFWVKVNGHHIDLGQFHHRSDDQFARYGETGGYKWFKEISAPRENFYGRGWADQKHDFKVLIPTSKADGNGNVKIRFGSNLNSDRSDESWALNDVRTLNTTKDHLADFASYKDLSTATNLKTSELPDGYIVRGVYSGNESTQQSFNYNGSQYGSIVKFNFWELDSWDYEELTVTINGNRVTFDPFQVYADTDAAAKSGKQNGIYWYKTGSDDATQLNGARWLDQVHTIEMFVPKAKLGSTNKINVKFETNLNSGITDESWAISELKVSDATSLEYNDFFLRTGEVDALRGQINALKITTPNQSDFNSLWNHFLGELGNNGMRTHAEEINLALTQQSLDQLSRVELERLSSAFQSTMNDWNRSDGFSKWSEVMWNAYDDANSVPDLFMASMLIFTSTIANTASVVNKANPMDTLTAAAGGIYALTNLVRSSKELNTSGQINSELPDFTVDRAVEKIFYALKAKGSHVHAKDIVNSAAQGVDAFGDFMKNAWLIDQLQYVRNNQRLDSSDIFNSADLRDLGFNATHAVDTQFHGGKLKTVHTVRVSDNNSSDIDPVDLGAKNVWYSIVQHDSQRYELLNNMYIDNIA